MYIYIYIWCVELAQWGIALQKTDELLVVVVVYYHFFKFFLLLLFKNNNNNNNSILYSSQREIKAVVRSHNEEHNIISIILSHETHAHTHIHTLRQKPPFSRSAYTNRNYYLLLLLNHHHRYYYLIVFFPFSSETFMQNKIKRILIMTNK